MVSIEEGTPDDAGVVRAECFESGEYTVTFPELDKEAWEELP